MNQQLKEQENKGLIEREVRRYERWIDSHEWQFCWRGMLTLALTTARIQMGLSQINTSGFGREMLLEGPDPSVCFSLVLASLTSSREISGSMFTLP